MSINILSINTIILQKFEEDEKNNESMLRLIEKLLNEKNINNSVRNDLICIQQKIIEEKHSIKDLYLAKTCLLVEEYAQILKKPISHKKENNLPILRKKHEILIKYLNIVNQLVKTKKWDISLPFKSPKLNDPISLEYYCPTCENNDDNKFEVDEFNRRTCLDCSTQQSSIETGITHKDYSRVNIVGKFIYNRILHFQDCIKQYQGKQNCKIPDQLYIDLDKKFQAYRLIVNTATALGGSDAPASLPSSQGSIPPLNEATALSLLSPPATLRDPARPSGRRAWEASRSHASAAEPKAVRDGPKGCKLLGKKRTLFDIEDTNSMAPWMLNHVDLSYREVVSARLIRYSKITRNHIMMFLKELKYTKHYENVNLIYFTLTNKRVDDISHLEEQLIEDFKELVSLYDELHGKDKEEELDRKNFMNVQYLLFQLLRRHNHSCKIEDFTILKTIDRKLFHDTICKNLFNKLGWKFTPTF